MTGSDDKKRPAALNLTPARSPSTGSNSSSDSSLKHPRTPRFAEATSVHSPVEPTRSPFADPEKAQVVVQAQPADIGFGYINNGESQVPKTPLRSAMKIPGTPGRRFGNPMSPTFNEAEVLEKRELATDKEQARDLKIKTRVRMAKFALRGVNFSCSLIILCMLSSTFAIFNASKGLATQSSLPPWADGTNTWPQKLVLAMACVSLTACIIVFITFFRRGHKRAEKVNTYYHMFAIGWFIVSLVLWGVTAALYQNSRNNSNNKDMWGWSCVNNKRESIFEDQVNYQLICRLQNWAMICIIIEVVIEVLCIILYSVVFYRYYTKRRLAKTMDNRDRARSDLYLAQLRAQSAPNTPGFGPKSPALSQYAMSPRHPPAAYRNLGDIEESPFTPGGKIHEPTSQFNSPKPDFKLQAPPKKAPSATPKTEQSPFTPVSGQSPFSPTTESGPSSNNQNNQNTTTIADDEPVYDAVPIPGAYAGQAYKPHLEQR